MNVLKYIFLKGKNFLIRVQSIILDLPAKAAVLKVKQFNGEFGCIHCFHPGEWCSSMHKRLYPPKQVINLENFIIDLFSFWIKFIIFLKIDMRTNDEFRSIAKLAKVNNEIVFGIKGYTPLLNIVNFDSFLLLVENLS